MIGRKIIYKDTLDSTNNYVANLLLEEQVEHGTAILAGNQTAGKGQRGNIWDCEPYTNISMSCYLKHDNLAVSQHFLLNQVISLSCLYFLKHYAADFKIKWPNDLVHGNAKVGGILIENQLEQQRIRGSIVGIGLNINQLTFGNYNATSLKAICKQHFDIRELSLVLLEKLDFWYTQLNLGKSEFIQSEYLENLWLYGQEAKYSDANGEFTGTITGIDDYGQLQVEREGQVKLYQNKELVFLARYDA